MINRVGLFFCMFIILLISACKDNRISLESAGLRGEVTGNWEPLDEGDTLEVYVHLNNQIHLGNPSFEITSLPEAHTKTFQVWTDTNYARDSLHVYYPIETNCTIIDEQTVCYATNYIIENAKSDTFRYLGNDYATDGNELFFKGKVIRGSNNEGF